MKRLVVERKPWPAKFPTVRSRLRSRFPALHTSALNSLARADYTPEQVEQAADDELLTLYGFGVGALEIVRHR